ncbi:MAG TPA: VOC family protein [Ilumatobacteraceae bacterium]
MAQVSSSGPAFQHIALMVRDIDKSHRFYTEALGFEQCAALDPQMTTEIAGQPVDFRFYRGAPDRHHDFALVQTPNPSAFPAADTAWNMFDNKVGINHIAICYPSRDEFLARLRHLREIGIEFRMRGNHGMTHSVYVSDPDGNGVEVLYELPEEVWVHDVNGALNYFDPVPLDGDESLDDRLDNPVFSGA